MQHAVFLDLEAVKFTAELFIQFSLVSQVFLEVTVDDVLDAAYLVELPLQVIGQALLSAQLGTDVVLLLTGLLELGQDKVKSLHEGLLVLLEHRDLVFVLLMGGRELPVGLDPRASVLNVRYPIAKAGCLLVELVLSRV